MLLGPANPNNANDNTSGVVTVLEIMRTLPENYRTVLHLHYFEEMSAEDIAAVMKKNKKQI